MLRYRSYGKQLGPQIAFNMVELLEYSIVFYGIAIFAFDNMLSPLENFSPGPILADGTPTYPVGNDEDMKLKAKFLYQIVLSWPFGLFKGAQIVAF